MITTRRDFLKTTAGLTAGFSVLPLACQSGGGGGAASGDPLYRISLAQWSLNRAYFGARPSNFGQRLHSDDYRTLLAGELDPIDFPVLARQEYGIEAVELVNTFYFDRARDMDYLRDLKGRADGEGVSILLIMCDAEGDLGHPDEARRVQTVENHHKWVEAAAFLGGHSIRVNAASDRSLSFEEQQRLAADGLRRLCEFGDQHDINVIVENHGGLSSNGQWLAGVMEMVDHPRAGTLPDFGNFRIAPMGSSVSEEDAWYDRYQGVAELMPYAKAVSAKSQEFDAEGNEVRTDYRRMMQIVLDAGYRGWVGIEYEGDGLSEPEGIRATKALLERVREELTPAYA